MQPISEASYRLPPPAFPPCMHRSFWTGLAAILLAITCIAAGWLWMMPHFNSPPSLPEEERSGFYLEEDVEPVFPTTPTSSPVAIPVSNTSTRFALHQPPLNYLLGVKGDPKLEAKDIAVRVPVLMYHHIRPLRPSFTAKDRLYTVTPEAFRAQMEALHQAGYVTITPRDLQAALEGRMLLPEKSVLLTFDDGYREHFTRVFPILKELGLKATYFIISQADTSPAHMTQAMIKEVDASGLSYPHHHCGDT